MKKLVFLSIISLSLVSAASAASIMCETAGWAAASKIVEREASGLFKLNNEMPTKGFMMLETQADLGGVSQHLNIVFDNEKAFVCSSPEDNPDNQVCEAYNSIDEIKNRIGGSYNKILSFKAFYSTPRGLLSVNAPAPGTDRFADLREDGVEVCFIR